MILLDSSSWCVVHTSDKGRGIIATKTIPAGIVIGDYIGRVVSSKDDSDEHGLYGMCWSDIFVIQPDRATIGLHIINHSCMPNCGMYPYHGHILYVSLRKIFLGEELTVSYMVEPSRDPDGLYACVCDTELCTGTMMTTRSHAKPFWDRFVREKQGKFADTPPVPIGEIIHPLLSYPKQVSDCSVYDMYGNVDKPPYTYRGKKQLTVPSIRTIIRDTGVCIRDTVRNRLILGICEGECISKPF